MFLDSKEADKVKYMMQFGIAPCFQNIILDELKGLLFSFRFDETTSQVKKQHNAYATSFYPIQFQTNYNNLFEDIENFWKN